MAYESPALIATVTAHRQRPRRLRRKAAVRSRTAWKSRTRPPSRPAIEAVAKAFRRIDALVNCAGITGRTNIPGHEVDLADFDLVYRVNLRGAFLLSKAVLPHMLARK